MSKPPDVRKLKDQATKALEKKSYAKAAELYVEIALLENDPDWRQRAGEAWRKAGKTHEAAEQFVIAAEGYAQGGFLLKAIAVAKVVLQLDPRHTATQTMLAELYAQRDGSVRSPSGRVAMQGDAQLARTESGNFEMVRPAPPPPLAMDALPMRAAPPPIALDPPEPRPLADLSVAIDDRDTVAIDDLPGRATTLPSGAPMDVLPLATLFKARKSSQFGAVRPEAQGVDLPGSAYEISLDDAPDLGGLADQVAAQLAREIPLAVVEPPRPAPALTGDELDFSSVMEDAPAPAPAPIPVVAVPPPVGVMRADELDFSSLLGPSSGAGGAERSEIMDEMAVTGKHPRPVRSTPVDELAVTGKHMRPPAAPPPRPPLPRIPLFSSLTPDELMHVIAGMEVREFAPGDAIVRQGDRGVALYVIVRGQVEVVLEGPPRKEIATLTEGAFFGELALLTDFPRSASVIAQEPTQVLEISRELIASVIANSPDVLKVLLRFFRDRMVDRLLSTSRVFANFNVEDAKGLVGRFKFLELDPKMRVVREGERAPGMFLLLCGDAYVVQGHKQIAKLDPGDLFGEMSLLTRGPAMASIDTESKCWALQLPQGSFQEIMLTYPQLLEYVSSVAEKRREQNLDGPDGRVDFL